MGLLYRRDPSFVPARSTRGRGPLFGLPRECYGYEQVETCLGREKVDSRIVACYVSRRVLCRDIPCRGTIFIKGSRSEGTECTFLQKVCRGGKGKFGVRRAKDRGGCDFYVPPRERAGQITMCRTYVSTLTRVALRRKGESGCHLSLKKVTTPGRGTLVRDRHFGGPPSTLRRFLGGRPRVGRVRVYASGSFTKE